MIRKCKLPTNPPLAPPVPVQWVLRGLPPLLAPVTAPVAAAPALSALEGPLTRAVLEERLDPGAGVVVTLANAYIRCLSLSATPFCCRLAML